MNKVKKIMFVMIASLSTMSLFSFKSAEVNETSFRNANVATHAAYDSKADAAQTAIFTAVIRAAKKAWEKSTRDIVYVTTAATDFTGVQYNEYSTNEVTVKSQTILAKL